jgi:hypothetical protein
MSDEPENKLPFDIDEKLWAAMQKNAAAHQVEYRKIKKSVSDRYEKFDKARLKLTAAYEKATTPKARLKALAKIVRQHGEYTHHGLMASWQTEAVIIFANHIDAIAEDL